MRRTLRIAVPLALVSLIGCGGSPEGAPPGGGRGPGAPTAGQGRPGAGAPPGAATAAVPVEVVSAVRRPISAYIETNGVLEAEYEVDIVARVSAPVVRLMAEEGLPVARGQLVAALDDVEYRQQLEVSRVTLNETELAYERARELQRDQLISSEEYERAKAAYESAQAQYRGNEIQLGYTEIRAPFDGLIVRRYVDVAQQLSVNTPVFRISDFNPLLCPIQLPERDLSKLRLRQRAYVTVESWPDERFEASVLRISPIVDAASGTIKVTLDVAGRGKLRPGMFARVFVETESRPDAVVIPKAALSLESIGDTVYVASGELAARREVTLGFREGDFVEVVSGVEEGQRVVVVGQDGLSEGTPIQVLKADGRAVRVSGAGPAADPGDSRTAGQRPDFSRMTPEQLEQVRQRMRSRGMTEEQIEERIRQAGERATQPVDTAAGETTGSDTTGTEPRSR